MARKSSTSMSITDLQREIAKRQKDAERKINSLYKKREKLEGQIADVDAEISTLETEVGLASRRRGGKRPKNDLNLADALAKVLTKKTMGVTEVAEAVQHAGYKTTSPNFRTIVNQTLINDKRFKRVSRGQYTTKASVKG
ncbi:MAG: hypothetical protein AAGD00_08385 [Planctomycetota bacterium]